MGKRFVVVGSATAVAGLVLGASIVLGPASTSSPKPTLPDDIAPPSIDSLGDASGNPPSVSITGWESDDLQPDGKGQYNRTRLRAKRAKIEVNGISKLIEPYAEIRLGTQRAITLTADEADVEMEDETPLRGQFSGNVVVTIAQAPEGTKLILDPEDPRHAQFIQQRIYLDEATDFSIENDTISTKGPVHVTSEQVDFFGLGLQLAYNTQRERIEQLVIDQGRYLIINPEADAPGFSNPTRANAEKRSDEAADPAPQAAPLKQFYNATFQGDVLVRDGLESQLAGQTLKIDFSLGTDAVEVTPIAPDAIGQLPRVIPTGQLVQTTGDALPALLIPERNLDRTLLSHLPERDLVVTWTGPLTVLPYPEKPKQLADEDDAHITLTGPNAYAQTTDEDGQTSRLETNRLEYLLSQEKTTAYTSDDRALRILSDALGGEITGQQLTVRQQAGTATILGPGELTYTSDKDGKTLNLTWQNRLDLELFVEASTQTPSESENEASSTSRSQTKILGVETATFDGDVTAKHTDFDLKSDKLTLTFEKPDKFLGVDNYPTAINAAGNVAVTARGDAVDETFDITAGRLSIDLQLDQDDEPYASAIRAIDDVHVHRPGSELTCNRVSLELLPPHMSAERSGASDTDTQDPRFAQVRTILAVGQVRATIDDIDKDRRVDLLADELQADVQKDTLTLSSRNAAAPAEITDLTTGRKITGQLIEMDDQAKQLNITGPGSLATVLDDPKNPQATIEDTFLAINWTKSMAFDNTTGVAEFHENVRSESRRSTDSSEMTCDHLHLVLSTEDPDDADAKRQVRSATATGNVQFLASNWQVGQPKQIDSRIRLEGPKLRINNQPAEEGKQAKETLIVDGQGRMVLEDYRAPEEQNADDQAALTGRGATLFSWNRSMTLDARTNTATLVSAVQMVHIPKDDQDRSGDPVQLDCEELVADLTDTGGLAAWLAEDNEDAAKPDAQIQSIVATDNVQLLQQGTRSMRGDTLTFAGESNLVTLIANPGRDVILEDLNRDTTTRTNKVTWDLTKDQIEIDQLRGGVAPLN